MFYNYFSIITCCFFQNFFFYFLYDCLERKLNKKHSVEFWFDIFYLIRHENYRSDYDFIAVLPLKSIFYWFTGMKVGQLHAKVVLALLLRDYEMWQTKDNESFLNPRSTFTAAANGINLHFKKIITRASN